MFSAGPDVTVTTPTSINSVDISAGSGNILTINSGQSLTVTGAATVTGSGTTNLITSNGSLSAGSLDMTASSPTGGRVSQVLIGTGSVTTTGSYTFSSCALSSGAPNCYLTFSAAGIVHVGGNLGAGGSLQNFATAPGSTVNFNSSGTGTIGAYAYQNLTVNKSGGAAATLAGSTTVNGNLTVNSGVFAGGGSLTLTLDGSVSNFATIQLDGGAAGCGSTPDALLIRSTVAGTQRSWSGGGTFTLQDVNVQDQTGSAAITARSSTNTGNNGANWTFL